MKITTDQVREAFATVEDDAATKENMLNFDRWLKQVKAEAWQEGHLQGWKDMIDDRGLSWNPYRQGED